MHAARLTSKGDNQVKRLKKYLRSVGGGRVLMRKNQGWVTTRGIAWDIGSYAPSTVISALRQELLWRDWNDRYNNRKPKREWIEVSRRGTKFWWYRLRRKGWNE